MIRRQTLKVILMYAISIVLFWNLVIAIRAYRFTHFNTPTTQTAAQADLLSYISNRIGGSKYYKTSVTITPAIRFTTLQITTEDNKKLQGWYLSNTNAKGTCIVFHGLAGNRAQMLAEIEGLHNLGYNVLATDFRAHGHSEGTATTLGKNESKDVKAAYDYVKATGEKNIILYGASMGAASIAACLDQNADVQPTKVVLDMPFDNFEHLMERFFRSSPYPSQPTFTLFTFWASVFNSQWMFNVKPTDYVKSIKCPTLVQWGRLDELVPQESIDNVVANIHAQKSFVTYENAGHESFIKNDNVKWNETIKTFLEK